MDKRNERDTFDEAVEKIGQLLRLAMLLMVVVLMAVMTAKIAAADHYTCVVHKGEWVWIRSEPSPTARQIGRVRYGYEIDGELDNGYISVNPKPGWMLEGEIPRRGYVDAAYFDRPIKETTYRVATAGGPLAKRETPEGRLMCWIKPGVKISVLAWRYSKSGELWAKVYKGGYVAAKYLTEL